VYRIYKLAEWFCVAAAAFLVWFYLTSLHVSWEPLVAVFLEGCGGGWLVYSDSYILLNHSIVKHWWLWPFYMDICICVCGVFNRCRAPIFTCNFKWTEELQQYQNNINIVQFTITTMCRAAIAHLILCFPKPLDSTLYFYYVLCT
jgi:hypothetical protein